MAGVRASLAAAGRRHVIAAAAAGALLLGACSAGSTTSGFGSPAKTGTGGVGLVAYVGTVAKRTAAQVSADLSLTMDIHAAGQSVTVNGTGQLDFAHRAMTMTMTMSMGGMSGTMREVMSGGAVYVSMDMAGQSMKQILGKDWLRVPLGSAATSSFTQDPLQLLDQLQQTSGVTVSPLGPSTVDGLSVDGYAVTVNNLAAVAGAKQRLGSLGLSPEMQQKMLDVLAKAGPLHMTVYIDPAKHLLRRTTLDMNLDFGSVLGQEASKVGPVAATATLDFTHYGTPVHITAPPANDVTDMPNLGSMLPGH